MATALAAPLISGPAVATELDGVRSWRRSLADRQYAQTRSLLLADVPGWSTAPGLPAFRHQTSRFFSVIGIEAHDPVADATWMQPMIDQPEVGLLAIAITPSERGHAALIQAKAEPGNVNGIQLSPTVQATRSNSQRAHSGRAVPYLDLFARRPEHALVDTRQSEHGAVFLRKRNRVMVVEVPPFDPLPGFRWIELADLLGLLRDDDLVHADTRAVLACLPWTFDAGCGGECGSTLRRSLRAAPNDERLRTLARWMSAERSVRTPAVRIVPLPELTGWTRSERALQRTDGRGFEVVAVEVEAQGREVDGWAQPMVHPRDIGLTGLAMATVDGEARLLMRMCPEPGLVDGAELGPTVQCEDAEEPPGAVERDLMHLLLSAAPADTVFDSVLSDEGGRFLHGRQRHLIVRVDPFPAPAGYQWCRLAELTELLIHSHQVNMQARSAFVCLLATLCGTP